MRSRTSACRVFEWPNGPNYGNRDKRWGCRDDEAISTAKDFDVSLRTVLERAAEQFEHIALDKEILGGTPRIANTRIPIYKILDAVDYYGNLEGALKSYPQLSLEQVKEAMAFAGQVLEHPVDDKSENPS